MARGAGTDRFVAAAAVALLQPAHGFTLLPPCTRLLALQNVRRRTLAVERHQLEAGGARALKRSPHLLSSPFITSPFLSSPP